MPKEPPPRIGLIVECGREGAEWRALPVLIEKIRPGTTVDRVAMDNKDLLLQGCADEARTLLDVGCDRVFIVWDLRPPWDDEAARPSCKDERQTMIDTLNRGRVDLEKVVLLCITMEFEAWLIADGAAITRFLDPANRFKAVSDDPKPEQNQNPKGTLNTIFKPSKYREYLDREHAHRICQQVTSLSRMKKTKSFKRFVAKLTAI